MDEMQCQLKDISFNFIRDAFITLQLKPSFEGLLCPSSRNNARTPAYHGYLKVVKHCLKGLCGFRPVLKGI